MLVSRQMVKIGCHLSRRRCRCCFDEMCLGEETKQSYYSLGEKAGDHWTGKEMGTINKQKNTLHDNERGSP